MRNGVMAFCSFFAALCLVPQVAAQLAVPPDDDRPASRLAPLDKASPWHARFDAAARTLLPAIAHGKADEWGPMFGGQWLGEAERARIAAQLSDESAAFRRAFASRAANEHVILGWKPPGGDAAYATLADRPEADAFVCWRAFGDDSPWPQTAAEAEDRQRHACVRMSYSVRFDPPQWRAYLDAPLTTVN